MWYPIAYKTPATRVEKEQAGNGPSRSHIQGSKIAKGLPSDNLQYSRPSII